MHAFILFYWRTIRDSSHFLNSLEFCHKESREETSVGLVYCGKVGRVEKKPEGRETFGIKEYNSL
jgi:hypothetical protein